MTPNGIASNAGYHLERCWGCDIIRHGKQRDCVCKPIFTSEVMRHDRNDGAGHRLVEKQQSCRWIVRRMVQKLKSRGLPVVVIQQSTESWRFRRSPAP